MNNVNNNDQNTSYDIQNLTLFHKTRYLLESKSFKRILLLISDLFNLIGDDINELRNILTDLEREYTDFTIIMNAYSIKIKDDIIKERVNHEILYEDTISWVLQPLNQRNRKLKTMKINLDDLNQLKIHDSSLRESMNKNRVLINEIDIYYDNILSKTNKVSHILHQKDINEGLSKFIYELQNLNNLLNNKKEFINSL